MDLLTDKIKPMYFKYLGTNALSVYGIIINISTFVQCCAYSIGQASQPIISTNYGAGKGERIKEILKYAVGTAAVFGVVWTALAVSVPNLFIRIFMTPTEEILEIAPSIIRSYGISFLILALPMLAGGDAIWFSMPLTELIVVVYVVIMMAKYTGKIEVKKRVA